VLIGDGLGALISLVVEHGFYLPRSEEYRLFVVDTIIVGLFALCALARWIAAPDRRLHFRKNWIEILVVAALGVQAGALLWLSQVTEFRDAFFDASALRTAIKIAVFGLQGALLLQILVGLARVNESLADLRARPAVVLLASYAILIFFGAFILMLPRCTPGLETRIRFVDALFTSASASCVTGLNAIDVGRDLSIAGQWVTLGLIQIGGLGLITFAAFLSYLERHNLGTRELLMLRDTFGYNVIGEMGRFLGYTLAITFGTELIGTALVFVNLNEPDLDFGERLRWSVYHSISAFNNAGFALKNNAMLDYAGSVGMTASLCMLVVTGGLGFPVIMGLLRFRLSSLAFVRRRLLGPKRSLEIEPSVVSLQTKIVLTMTLLLIVGGAFLIWALERSHALEGRPIDEQIDVAVWHSVMARTAGFNSIDLGALRPTTLIVIILLMVVGASPISTAGGVKTVAVAVLFASLRSMLRGQKHMHLFKRGIASAAANLAFATLAVYLALTALCCTMLTLTDPENDFLALVFETVSALSTVGYSTGITPRLSDAGKIILSAAMLLGRTGPLLLLLGLAARRRASSAQYPGEQLVVS
jgi:Trk-type K+ transport system membrane component